MVEKRSSYIRVRVTERQGRVLREQAERQRRSLSSTVRHALVLHVPNFGPDQGMRERGAPD